MGYMSTSRKRTSRSLNLDTFSVEDLQELQNMGPSIPGSKFTSESSNRVPAGKHSQSRTKIKRGEEVAALWPIVFVSEARAYLGNANRELPNQLSAKRAQQQLKISSYRWLKFCMMAPTLKSKPA